MRPDLLCALTLAALMLAAVATDIRARRIPNLLTGAGIVVGLLLQALLPRGNGLFDFSWGSLGLLPALAGLGVGFALFLPLHLLRVLGAGDVKLLAMAGVWLGPKLVLGAALLALVAGGALALATMFASGTTRRVLLNVRVMLTTAVVGAHAGRLSAFDSAMTTGVRMPYAIAIAAGTLAQVGWQLFGANA